MKCEVFCGGEMAVSRRKIWGRIGRMGIYSLNEHLENIKPFERWGRSVDFCPYLSEKYDFHTRCV